MALPVLVQQLKNPALYSDSPHRVQLVQTHISYVFITRNHVYKMKKPVNFGFLDYSTLKKRKYYCQEEIKLNRRLCPDIYLGMVEVREKAGKVNLGDSGKTLDYLVKMKRLPEAKMMDKLMLKNKTTKEVIDKIAQKVASFHCQAATGGKISQGGSLKAIKENVDENFVQTLSFVGQTISQPKFDAIKSYSYQFLKENKKLLEDRVKEQKIRDCHGDLYSKNICLSEDIYIYDCIEFNTRFRYADVASEVAFLAMDLDFYNRGDLSNFFVNSYIKYSSDFELGALLNFYKCYRAYVRGKVHSFVLEAEEASKEEKKLNAQLAKRYFNLAYSYVAKRKPTLIVMSGPTGIGKTYLAEKIAEETQALVISSDVVRKHLAGIELTQRVRGGFEEGIYTKQFSKLTYQTMYKEAAKLLLSGISVILDATFLKKQSRRQAHAVAGKARTSFLVVECHASEQAVRKRLLKRAEDRQAVSDGRWPVYLEQRKAFESADEVLARERIIIDTQKSLQNSAKAVLRKISSMI